ncbi:MAG: tetratricopeptide repeat protein [Flavobacteriales bacterium]|nr:tetratricopeptide repeat protein [Flavobacteriales bacterium]
MLRTLLPLVACVLASIALAQDPAALRSTWKNTALGDSVRLMACYDLVWEGYMYSDPDSAVVLAREMQREARLVKQPLFDALAYDLQAMAAFVQGDLRKALAIYDTVLPMHERNNIPECVADAIGNMAHIRSYLGEHQEAVDLYERAHHMHQERKDTMGMANDINAIGRIHLLRGDHARALDHFMRGITLLRTQQDERGIVTALHNLGAVHSVQGDHTQALEYHREAFALAQKLDDRAQMGAALVEIGSCQQELSDNDAAMISYQGALTEYRAVGATGGIANTLCHMGDLLRTRGQNDEALLRYTEAEAIATTDERPFQQAMALIGAGHVLLAMGRPSEALVKAQAAIPIADDYEDLAQRRDAAQLLYNVLSTVGRKADALHWHERYVQLNDSIMRQENQRAAIRNDFAYANEKQLLADSLHRESERLRHSSELATHRSRNQLLIATLLVLGLIAFGFWNRSRYTAKANKAIQAAQDRVVEIEKQREAEAVRTRIARDIHDDIGGDITKIGLLSHEARRLFDQDPGSAFGTLTRIGDLSREVSHALHDVVNTVDPRSDDLALVMTHAREMVTRLLEGTALNAELVFQHHGNPRTLDPERKRGMLLLLKEAVNNVLKHAGASRLTISFTTDNSGFDLLVKDDGRGFDTTTRGGGNGLRNMHARANALGAEVLVTSAPGRGCAIHVHGGLDVQPTTNVVFPTAHPPIDLRT